MHGGVDVEIDLFPSEALIIEGLLDQGIERRSLQPDVRDQIARQLQLLEVTSPAAPARRHAALMSSASATAAAPRGRPRRQSAGFLGAVRGSTVCPPGRGRGRARAFPLINGRVHLFWEYPGQNRPAPASMCGNERSRAGIPRHPSCGVGRTDSCLKPEDRKGGHINERI